MIRKELHDRKKNVVSISGRDLDRMIYNKSHTQPVVLSSCQGGENILGFRENHHASEKNCDSAPNSTGVNRLICVIASYFYAFQRNRIKRKRIGPPVRIRAGGRFFQKNRLFTKYNLSPCGQRIPNEIFPNKSHNSISELMSNNCIGFDSQESKENEELGISNRYTTTPIRINS